MLFFVFFFKQKTAYEMRISDWSSDVCSSDLIREPRRHQKMSTAATMTSHVVQSAIMAASVILGSSIGRLESRLRRRRSGVPIFPVIASMGTSFEQGCNQPVHEGRS